VKSVKKIISNIYTLKGFINGSFVVSVSFNNFYLVKPWVASKAINVTSHNSHSITMVK
jgi:hypothetical protein